MGKHLLARATAGSTLGSTSPRESGPAYHVSRLREEHLYTLGERFEQILKGTIRDMRDGTNGVARSG